MERLISEAKKVLGAVRRHLREIELAVFLLIIFAIGMFFLNVIRENLGLEERPVALGATFSIHYAEELGLDWEEVYLAALDDLKVRRFRIPIYWDDIEAVQGEYDFSTVDWQLEQAARRGTKVILAIGRKLPRWPECHAPEWTADLEEVEVQEHIIRMLEEVVRHYSRNTAVVAWQVENEPLFRFGECPPPDRKFLQREIAAVRALDDRPVMITESGELSTWLRAAGLSDILGISTYREVWTKYIGRFYWPITPNYYSRRARVILPLIDKIIVSELQAEPWSPGPIAEYSIEEQLRVMNAEKLNENVSFVRKVGFPEAYLWGIEWWYWMKTKGFPELWNAGKAIFATSNSNGVGGSL